VEQEPRAKDSAHSQANDRLDMESPVTQIAAKKACSTRIIGSTSAAPAISRQECMESMGLPTSTAGIPVRAALIGPIVEPHGPSLRGVNCCGTTPTSAQSAAKAPAVRASLA